MTQRDWACISCPSLSLVRMEKKLLTNNNSKTGKLTIDGVEEIILCSMTEDDRISTAFYIDEVLREKGDTVVIGENKYPLMSDTIVVFIDDNPGKNWGHECRYLFFDVHTSKAIEIDEKFPPSLTDVPGTYRVIWAPKGIPLWALWSDT